MDRRDFPRGTTVTVATGDLLDLGTATADPNGLWREYLAAPDRHSRIPNVSHPGERRLRVRAVFGAAGDGVTDSTAGPRWGARFCRRNLEVPGGHSHGIRLEEHAAAGAMVGIRGTSGPTDRSMDFIGDLSTVGSAPDDSAWPADLYEAQLRHRLQ